MKKRHNITNIAKIVSYQNFQKYFLNAISSYKLKTNICYVIKFKKYIFKIFFVENS